MVPAAEAESWCFFKNHRVGCLDGMMPYHRGAARTVLASISIGVLSAKKGAVRSA
jgi:hypothetical protein